jgi:energy-coupling factor transporter ATP-binding protein EcfA2
VEAVALGVRVHVVSGLTGQGCDELRARLEPGVTAVLLGSSGVGKSTLVNRFVGSERMAVKETRVDDDEGRHTTVHRELIELPGGGVVIDTPGIRELQLWDGGGIDEAFADVEALAADCRFNDYARDRARVRGECGARLGRAHRGALRKLGRSCNASCGRSRSARMPGCRDEAEVDAASRDARTRTRHR